jgi:hypothetical protein
MRKPSKPSYESFMILNGKEGQVFYTPQLDIDLTSLASKLGRKISTENYYALKSSIKKEGRKRGVPEVINLTKVTLL